MRKNFKNELMKQRDSIALEKMATMPFEVLELMDRMIKAKKGWNENEELDLRHCKHIFHNFQQWQFLPFLEVGGFLQVSRLFL